MVAWEQDVIREVLDGNQSAYARLVREYQEPIRHSVARILRDSDSAQDVTQDAFLAAYENLDRFDASRSFFSWLYRIAKNRALNCNRRDRRRRSLQVDEHPATSRNPEERFLALEQEADLHGAIRSLPRKYLTVLILRHYLDCSYADIGNLLELPRSTVRSRIYTARRLLAKRLS